MLVTEHNTPSAWCSMCKGNQCDSMLSHDAMQILSMHAVLSCVYLHFSLSAHAEIQQGVSKGVTCSCASKQENIKPDSVTAYLLAG